MRLRAELFKSFQAEWKAPNDSFSAMILTQVSSIIPLHETSAVFAVLTGSPFWGKKYGVSGADAS